MKIKLSKSAMENLPVISIKFGQTIKVNISNWLPSQHLHHVVSCCVTTFFHKADRRKPS